MLNESLEGAWAPAGRPIRVLLVDDTAVVLQTLRWRLEFEPDLQVVGQATRREEALALAPAVDPDVIVLDLRLPGTTELSLARELRRLRPQSALVILSADASLERFQAALEAEHWALVSKYEPVEVLLAALRAAAHATRDAA